MCRWDVCAQDLRGHALEAGIRLGAAERMGVDRPVAVAVSLGFVCAGVGRDVVEAGIRLGATAGGGGEGVGFCSVSLGCVCVCRSWRRCVGSRD